MASTVAKEQVAQALAEQQLKNDRVAALDKLQAARKAATDKYGTKFESIEVYKELAPDVILSAANDIASMVGSDYIEAAATQGHKYPANVNKSVSNLTVGLWNPILKKFEVD